MVAFSILSGFLIGAAGSAHCAGMCGPLCLALPLHKNTRAARFYNLALYQLGRIVTYSILGLIIGYLGTVFSFSGFSRGFSILIGAALALGALGYYYRKNIPTPFFLRSAFLGVQSLIASILKYGNRPPVVLAIGALNGLLPCGLVYLALLYGISFSSPWQSMLFMATFGLGTAPVMLASGMGLFRFRAVIYSYLRPAIPVMIGLMGVVLLLRGLNLGIPFISPFLPSFPGLPVDCHP